MKAAVAGSFGYGRQSGLIDGLSLEVRPGEKIGLVGRSSAGKSTLVNPLLRFFDLDEGCILIDGQDIAVVTQESLRAQISVVTQDTSLHRSIRDNIRYGKPGASDDDIVSAAQMAHAHEFVLELEDQIGQRGNDAQVGERGVAVRFMPALHRDRKCFGGPRPALAARGRTLIMPLPLHRTPP